jgi:hypothetical protein
VSEPQVGDAIDGIRSELVGDSDIYQSHNHAVDGRECEKAEPRATGGIQIHILSLRKSPSPSFIPVLPAAARARIHTSQSPPRAHLGTYSPGCSSESSQLCLLLCLPPISITDE